MYGRRRICLLLVVLCVVLKLSRRAHDCPKPPSASRSTSVSVVPRYQRCSPKSTVRPCIDTICSKQWPCHTLSLPFFAENSGGHPLSSIKSISTASVSRAVPPPPPRAAHESGAQPLLSLVFESTPSFASSSLTTALRNGLEDLCWGRLKARQFGTVNAHC